MMKRSRTKSTLRNPLLNANTMKTQVCVLFCHYTVKYTCTGIFALYPQGTIDYHIYLWVILNQKPLVILTMAPFH